MSIEEKIKIADEVMARMSTALSVEFTPAQRQFNRGYLVAMMDAAEQNVQRIGGRLCENCGEPIENHVGGVERGLCKNPANR